MSKADISSSASSSHSRGARGVDVRSANPRLSPRHSLRSRKPHYAGAGVPRRGRLSLGKPSSSLPTSTSTLTQIGQVFKPAHSTGLSGSAECDEQNPKCEPADDADTSSSAHEIAQRGAQQPTNTWQPTVAQRAGRLRPGNDRATGRSPWPARSPAPAVRPTAAASLARSSTRSTLRATGSSQMPPWATDDAAPEHRVR